MGTEFPLQMSLSPPMAARFLQNIFPDAASRTLDLAKLTDRKPPVFQLLGAGRNP
jgi:hypothetical protein